MIKNFLLLLFTENRGTKQTNPQSIVQQDMGHSYFKAHLDTFLAGSVYTFILVNRGYSFCSSNTCIKVLASNCQAHRYRGRTNGAASYTLPAGVGLSVSG